MKNYVAHAKRWKRGWEIHVDSVGVTQVRSLDRAVEQACDLVEIMTGRPITPAQVTLEVHPRSINDKVRRAREKTRQAQEAQVQAALFARKVITELRDEGLSPADIAGLMGITRGRVTQLLADS
jgi:DNA-directed RNA polymerase specialized sigma24 family protein